MQAHIKASFDASPITSQLRWTRLDVMTGLAPLHINNIEHLSLWDIFKLHVTSSLHKHTPKKTLCSLCTQKLFPQTFLHTKALTQRGFHTKKTFTQMLLHTNFRANDVTQKGFFETGDLHKNLHRNCLMQELLHTGDFTRKLFNANAFTPKKPLHTGDLTRLKPGGEGRKASRAGAILFDPSGRHVQYAACVGRKAIASKSLFMLYTIIRQAA